MTHQPNKDRTITPPKGSEIDIEVFILIGIFYYETSNILGVFSTMDKAVCAKMSYAKDSFDDIDIETHTLNE